MKVLYIYSGSRKDKFKGTIGVDFPDTQFYGLNHLSKFGIQAEYKEFSDIRALRSLNSILSFRLKHALATVYFSLKGDYDIIFGSSLIYGLFFKKIFGLKQRFVLLDISIGRTLGVNKGNRARYAFLFWLLSAADRTVSLSKVQKERIEKEMPQFVGKAFFAHLGVDASYLKASFEGRKDYILSAGRDNGRDYKTVVEVARLMPDRRFEIVCSPRNMAGIGEIPPNVSVIYDLPPHDLYAKFGEARMMVLATHGDDHADGSDCSGQTVLLEAMASGLPVIVTRKKYLSDYVADGADVLTADSSDADGIIARIKELEAGDRALGSARHARETAEKNLSTENMARELARVFNTINKN